VALIGESCVDGDLSKRLLGGAEFSDRSVDSQPAKIFADSAPMKPPENPRKMYYMDSGDFGNSGQIEIVGHAFPQQLLDPPEP
jgi:hypothetical protein